MNALLYLLHGEIADLKETDIATPLIQAGEVRVMIEFGDQSGRRASVQGRFGGSVLPRVVGCDFAGKIVDGRWV